MNGSAPKFPYAANKPATGCIREPIADDALLFKSYASPEWNHTDSKVRPLYRIARNRIINQGSFPFDAAAAWLHWLLSEPDYLVIVPSVHTIMLDAYELDGYDPVAYDREYHSKTRWRGTSLYAAAEAVRRRGFIEDHCWTNDPAEARLWVENAGPVVIATDWYASMALSTSKEIKITGTTHDYHAYVLNGWSRERQAFRMLNSHGLTWGNNSTKWIKFQDVVTLLRNGGVVGTGIDKQGGATARARAHGSGTQYVPAFSDTPTIRLRTETLQMLGISPVEGVTNE